MCVVCSWERHDVGNSFIYSLHGMQASFPLHHTTHHVYVYVCTNTETCNDPKKQGDGHAPVTSPSSWRALKTTARATVANEASAKNTREKNDRKQPSLAALDTSGWGFEATTTTENKQFDFSDLSAALDSSFHGISNNSSSRNNAKTKSPPPPLPFIQDPHDAVHPLPGFYLDMVSDTPPPRSGRIQKHIEELLTKYRVDGGVGWGEEGNVRTPHSGLTAATTTEEVEEEEGDDVQALHWDGEGYEQDSVLVIEGRKSVGPSFLQFMKKLQRIPDQCVRMCNGDWGRVLGSVESDGRHQRQQRESEKVGSDEDDDNDDDDDDDDDDENHDRSSGSTVNNKKVPLVEMVAPTIAALQESVTWLQEEGVDVDREIASIPGSWDWISVVVYGDLNDGEVGGYEDLEVSMTREE